MECFFINWLIILFLPVFFQVSLQEDIHFVFTEDENILKPNLGKNTYKPNSTLYWHITPSSKRESSTIEMTVKYIDIDDDAGNFLLIGGSSTNGNKSIIFGGPPPLLLSGKLENKKLLIATDAAYVVLVIKSKSKRKVEDFQISYQRTGVPVRKEETELPQYDLWNNAIPVCIKTSLNISEEKMINETLSTISILAEQYMKEENNRVTIRLRETDINILTYAKRKDGSFYLLFTITQPNDETKPLFEPSDKLREIVYNKNYRNYQFRECIEKFQDQIEMNIIYATIPFFLIFFLFVWWWRYNSFWNSRFKTTEEIKNDLPITLNIEMYPSQTKNPIYQPESPTSILEYEEQSRFSFSNVGFTQKEKLQQSDSNSSWSPEQSARNRKISRKKFVSFAVQQENEDEVDEDNSFDEVPKPATSNLQDTKL